MGAAERWWLRLGMRYLLTRSAALLLGVLALSLLVVLPSANAAETCTSGTYNYRQSMTGGCAWGNVSVTTVHLRIDAVVADNKSDGSCARIEILERLSFEGDNTYRYQACGVGSSTPAQRTINFQEGSASPFNGLWTGMTQEWSVRVCVGSSCTGYTNYYPKE
ncbi:MAG: hypothetical protein JWP74_4007 [Marmoricola sp.]|nr:hypothetical protein [Marmoricola sp.]